MGIHIKTLIVDDNPADSALLTRYLADSQVGSIEAMAVATGDEALESIKGGDPDVVFLDYLLGGETGIDVMRRLKQAGSRAAFILLTGMGGERAAVEALREGAHDYITKYELNQEILDHAILHVADLKTAEQERARLNTAIEQAAEMIIITDADGIIQYVNPAFEKITGYSRNDIIGQNPRIMKSGYHDKAFYDEMWRTILSGGTWRSRFINKKKDGTLYEEDATISPVFGREGEIANFVAVKRDITHEATLIKAKEYFTSITSHELRTPLTMLGLVRIFLNSLDDEIPAKDKVGQIRTVLDESCARLERIATATALLSEMSLTSPKDPKENALLYFELISSVQMAGHMIEKDQRRLSLGLEMAGLPKEIRVRGEGVMIRKVIDELISNAIKYTPDSKKITVRSFMRGDWAIVEITDEGIGLPAGKVTEIFEPYFSLEDARHHSSGRYKYLGGGIGLGLTIARMITEHYGGTINIDSSGENRGTKVTLAYPLSAGQ